MRYRDWIKYKEMSDSPDKYFKRKNVVNFDIIHHKCRGDPLQKTHQEHQTVSNDDLKNHPKKEKDKAVSAICRNAKRDDLWIKRDFITEHFKNFK